MQQGSLIALKEGWVINPEELKWCKQKGRPTPVHGEVYTCSGIGKSPNTTLDTLGIEELNPDIEAYYVHAFDEIQPPMNVAEFVEECCCVPFEI